VYNGVPYKIFGGHKFYDRKEVKDVLAYLSVIANPADTVRMKRIINEPKRGIGDTTINNASSIADGLGTTFYDVISHASDYPMLSRASAKLTEFTNLLNKLYELEGCVKKEFLNNPYWPFIINEHQITATNGGCHNIWGVYYLYPEADLYLELAKTVPNAAFDISSYRINEVGGGGCETFLYAKYENHTLTL
jgi:hypothetical protein